MTPLSDKEAAFPRLRISADQLMALPEYSSSYPTGTTIGKRWRRHDPFFDADERPRRIWVGEYYDVGSTERVGIRWYRPVLQVTALVAAPRPWWLFARTDGLIEAQLLEAAG